MCSIINIEFERKANEKLYYRNRSDGGKRFSLPLFAVTHSAWGVSLLLPRDEVTVWIDEWHTVWFGFDYWYNLIHVIRLKCKLLLCFQMMTFFSPICRWTTRIWCWLTIFWASLRMNQIWRKPTWIHSPWTCPIRQWIWRGRSAYPMKWPIRSLIQTTISTWNTRAKLIIRQHFHHRRVAHPRRQRATAAKALTWWASTTIQRRTSRKRQWIYILLKARYTNSSSFKPKTSTWTRRQFHRRPIWRRHLCPISRRRSPSPSSITWWQRPPIPTKSTSFKALWFQSLPSL